MIQTLTNSELQTQFRQAVTENNDEMAWWTALTILARKREAEKAADWGNLKALIFIEPAAEKEFLRQLPERVSSSDLFGLRMSL